MKESNVQTFEAAADRVRELNERVIESTSNAGVAGLQVYGRLLRRLAEAQGHAGRRGSEWLAAFGDAQATFARELAQALPPAARRTGERARSAAGAATRRAPSAKTGKGATNGRFPIANYDKLTAREIESRLSRLSKVNLAKVEAYERKHKNRATVLKKIASLLS